MCHSERSHESNRARVKLRAAIPGLITRLLRPDESGLAKTKGVSLRAPERCAAISGIAELVPSVSEESRSS